MASLVAMAPWGGVSPRTLTKAHLKFSLPSERATWPILDASGLQLELFPEGTSYGTF